MQPNEPISELARRLQSQATLQAVEDDERFAEQALGDLGEGDNEPAPSWRHLQAEADNRETPAALEGEGEQDADDDVPPPIKFNMVDDRDVEEMPLALAEQITASREKKRKPGDAEPEANTLPEDSEQVFVEQPEAEHDATSFDAEPQSIGNIEEKLIVLHVLAMHEGVFFGAHMQQLFAERGYEHGEMNIFHSRYEKQTVFSIANLVEPGYFDPQRMDVFTTPGITLFMRLPGPLPADVAFDVLVSEAREIARELGGEVQDAEHSTLTRQRIQSLREEVLDYIHRNRLASPGQHR
jgi:cell division protein ZipA